MTKRKLPAQLKAHQFKPGNQQGKKSKPGTNPRGT